MKYSEAEKQIETLSSKYDVNVDSQMYFEVCFKGYSVAIINKRYELHLWNYRFFSKLPFSNKLYMILSELAMTPLNERVEEKRYLVKAFGNYLNINVGNNRPHINTSYESSAMHTKFTDKEIEQLKQRDDIPLDWNKVTLEEAE